MITHFPILSRVVSFSGTVPLKNETPRTCNFVRRQRRLSATLTSSNGSTSVNTRYEIRFSALNSHFNLVESCILTFNVPHVQVPISRSDHIIQASIPSQVMVIIL